jgi:hypothetical protein
MGPECIKLAVSAESLELPLFILAFDEIGHVLLETGALLHTINNMQLDLGNAFGTAEDDGSSLSKALWSACSSNSALVIEVNLLKSRSISLEESRPLMFVESALSGCSVSSCGWLVG